MTKPFHLSPAGDRLLRGSAEVPLGLYQLQPCSAEQLCRLHYSMGSLTRVKALLKALCEAGYAQAGMIPTTKNKSPFYYTLGPAAVPYLASLGLPTHPAWRASKEQGRWWFYMAHHLGTNDLLISAALLARESGTVRLAHFTTERSLRRELSGRTKLIPDAFLDFHVTLADGRRIRCPVLLEHDHASEVGEKFRAKIRAYCTLLASRRYVELFGAQGITVAFSTFTGLPRLHKMRALTQDELNKAGYASFGPTFRFANLPQPPSANETWLSSCWLTPYDHSPQPLLGA